MTSDAVNTDCKWGPVRCCQYFADARVAVFFFGMSSFISKLVANGFVIVGLTSIEKRFNLSSTDIGIIVSAYETAALLCLLPVAYAGSRGSKPRWIGAGVFMMVVGSFLYSLPHFLTGRYTATDVDADAYCGAAFNVTATLSCDSEDDESLANYKYLFILSQFLNGIGFAPIFTIAFSYIDENAHPNNTPFYISLIMMFTISGAACGFIFGGIFINMHTDFDTTDVSKIDLDPDSEAWVGAWWVGPLIGAALAVLCFIPICGLPKRLPGWEKFEGLKNKEVHASSKDASKEDGKLSSLSDLPRAAKALANNPTFIFFSIAATSENFLAIAFGSLGFKYFELQFSVSASTASYLVGGVTVTCALVGALCGGFLIKRVQLKVPGILKVAITSACLSLLCVFNLLIRCDQPNFAGINVDYKGFEFNTSYSKRADDLEAICNMGCACAFENYDPVCSADDVTYFNPCAAGCPYERSDKIYRNCTCAGGGRVKEGICESDCEYWMYIFVALLGLVVFLQFTSASIGFSITLRCVEESYRSFALSVSQILVKLLGAIPGPIVFGIIFDSTCLFWLEKDCEDNGACYFYDTDKLSLYLLMISVVLKLISITFFSLSLIYYKPPLEEDLTEATDTYM